MSAGLFSGDAGDVTHPWRRVKRTLGEVAFDAVDLAALTGPRSDRIARAQARRRVLVIGVYRPGSLMAEAVERLRSERHEVRFALGAGGDADPRVAAETVAERLERGKFENLNRVLAAARSAAAGAPAAGGAALDAPAAGSAAAGAPPAGGLDPDWILVVDDDLRLPLRFLDRFLALCERFRLDLAQPAQTLRSHSAWRVTRRRPASLVRETRFVEIGPLTAFGRRAAAELVPFPELRFGWGLDLHWSALAAERGWRLGVVDATPVRHEGAVVGASYPRAEAEAEAAEFLVGREHLPAARAGDVLATHRRT
jgi:hypothetical protein